MKQIWQDTTFTVSALTQPISVTVDGNEIYRGVLSSYPGEDSVSTLLNRICEPFLEMDYPAISGVTTHSKAYRVFTVKDWSGNTLGTQDFIYDWSYEEWKRILTNPINGHLDPRMRLFYSMFNSTTINISVHTEVL